MVFHTIAHEQQARFVCGWCQWVSPPPDGVIRRDTICSTQYSVVLSTLMGFNFVPGFHSENYLIYKLPGIWLQQLAGWWRVSGSVFLLWSVLKKSPPQDGGGNMCSSLGCSSSGLEVLVSSGACCWIWRECDGNVCSVKKKKCNRNFI